MGDTQPKGSITEDRRELDALLRYLKTPLYHEVRPITGKAFYGRETRELALCSAERKHCDLPRNVDGSEQPCWLEFTDVAADTVARLTGGKRIEIGEYWVEGEGRIAVLPGSFGHANQFTCQVEMQSVRAFGKGPPWFWETPPEIGQL